MKYFRNVRTVEELRKQYKDLLKKYHPDNGGSEEATKEINAEYEQLFGTLPHESEFEQTEIHEDRILRAAINKIIHLNGIDIEICGSWVWVSGNTYPVRNEIKAAGYRFSKNKKMWYFHNGEYRRMHKGFSSIEAIRAKYGSQLVLNDAPKTITA